MWYVDIDPVCAAEKAGLERGFSMLRRKEFFSRIQIRRFQIPGPRDAIP